MDKMHDAALVRPADHFLPSGLVMPDSAAWNPLQSGVANEREPVAAVRGVESHDDTNPFMHRHARKANAGQQTSRARQTDIARPERHVASASPMADSVAFTALAWQIRSWLMLSVTQPGEPMSAASIAPLWVALEAHTHRLEDEGLDNLTSAEVVSRFTDIHAPRPTALRDRGHGGLAYLHANRLDMGCRHAFIAAQKPVACNDPGSAAGFWGAMQEHGVALIIDLTNDNDNAHEAHYGPTPHARSLTLEPVSVRLARQEHFDHGSVEALHIATSGVSGMHVVRRLKFDAWQDHGVISPTRLGMLAYRAETLCEPDATIAIHCRAGVGRTGTLTCFMAADDLISRTLHASPRLRVDTLVRITIECVLQGRRDRGPCFVQTSEQLRLVVNALLMRYAASLE
ncbi:MAG: hypothetical protein H7315_09940 [Herminiimonas sp.]|nr:hypothetical protein [Herminiimonas sp.]